MALRDGGHAGVLNEYANSELGQRTCDNNG
jgi:hypothetical protein